MSQTYKPTFTEIFMINTRTSLPTIKYICISHKQRVLFLLLGNCTCIFSANYRLPLPTGFDYSHKFILYVNHSVICCDTRHLCDRYLYDTRHNAFIDLHFIKHNLEMIELFIFIITLYSYELRLALIFYYTNTSRASIKI